MRLSSQPRRFVQKVIKVPCYHGTPNLILLYNTLIGLCGLNTNYEGMINHSLKYMKKLKERSQDES